jgi:hypothetical protein
MCNPVFRNMLFTGSRSCGARYAANGGYADVVAAGEFVERSASRSALGGFLLLCWC